MGKKTLVVEQTQNLEVGKSLLRPLVAYGGTSTRGYVFVHSNKYRGVCQYSILPRTGIAALGALEGRGEVRLFFF